MNHTLSKRLFLKLLSGLNEGFLELVCPEETYSFGSPHAELRAMIVVHDEALLPACAVRRRCRHG